MNELVNPEWWPLRQLGRTPILKVHVCGRRVNPPVFSHVVNFTRLEIPLRGKYRNQIESGGKIQLVSLSPGTALFAAPNCWNLPEWQPGLELLTIQFGRSQIGIRLVSAQSRKISEMKIRKHSLPRPLTGPLPHLLDALLEVQEENGSLAPCVPIVSAVMQCLENLIRQPQSRPVGRALTLLEEIRVFLQSHYQYEINRDSVARQFNITPNHLSRLFRSHGHMTLTGYLTQVRIDRAKHLLSNYNLKLDDIAARCGYNDTPYFCHVFKRLAKCTPIEYRLKERALKA